MKAMYIIPVTEEMRVESFAVMKAVSGPEGLNDGGQDPGTAIPQ